VDPICPLLTLGGDPRIVSAAPDAAHRCAAGGTLTTIERDYQARFCLTGRHETCERYVAHLAEVGSIGPTWRAAAPDATFASTRLVVDSAPRTVAGPRPRRLGTMAVAIIAVVLVAILVGWVGVGGLGALLGPGGSPSPSPSVSPSASPSESGEPSPSTEPSASPSVAPTPTPTPGPTPTPAPTPLTYIVQQGDTLNAIAARFGTTAQAIMEANGLESDVIHPGQVLIIPGG
jgi:LysM repeat protein